MKMDYAVLWKFSVLVVLIGVHGVGVDKVPVSVKKGDSVTLHTGVTINQDVTIRWFYQVTRIAEIDTDVGYNCTDVQCKDGDERFRDRLKLDHQTGSLTITNTRTTDSGEYKLHYIPFGVGLSETTYNVTVYLSVTPADKDTMKKTSDEVKTPVEAGESGSGLSPGAVAGIIVVVLLIVAVGVGVGVRYYLKRRQAGRDRSEII